MCVSGTSRSSWIPASLGANENEPLPGSPGDFSLAGIEVQAAEVEENVDLEAFPVAVTEGLLD